MSLDLKKLEQEFDDALAKETPETLNKFLTDIRTKPMSQKKSAEEILSKYESFHYSEDGLDETHYYRDNVLLAMEEYASQSRTTLTLEEEQAMDKLVFPVTYRQKSMIVQDKKKKSIVSLYGSELADATADVIGNLICRLLNAEQERRGK